MPASLSEQWELQQEAKTLPGVLRLMYAGHQLGLTTTLRRLWLFRMRCGTVVYVRAEMPWLAFRRGLIRPSGGTDTVLRVEWFERGAPEPLPPPSRPWES